MHARRAFLRFIGLGFLPAMLLAGCKHDKDGESPDSQRKRDASDGGGDSSGY